MGAKQSRTDNVAPKVVSTEEIETLKEKVESLSLEGSVTLEDFDKLPLDLRLHLFGNVC